MFQSVFVFIKFHSFLQFLIGFNIIQEVFVILIFLFIFLFLSLSVTLVLFNHHPLVLQFFKLEYTSWFFCFCQSHQNKLLIPLDVSNFFSIVEMSQIESFHTCSWGKISHVALNLDIYPFSTFGNVVVIYLRSILVESWFELVVVLSLNRIAI